jgi:AcrR family transcriptional regulator
MTRYPQGVAADRGGLLRVARALLADRDGAPLTVAEVCAAAGISRRAFYLVFREPEELMLALFDQMTAEIGLAMADAYRAEDEWTDSVRGALWQLLELFDEQPASARFLIVSSLAGDARMLARRAAAMKTIIDALEMDGLGADAGAVVGTVASVLHARLLEEPVPPLRELCSSLMGVIVLTRFGATAAQAELLRSPSDPRPRG